MRFSQKWEFYRSRLKQPPRRPFAGFSANRTRSHLWLLTINERHWTECSRSIGERHGESHRAARYAAGESRWVGDASIDRICVDVVRARDVESTIRGRTNHCFRVAKCAADVHVSGGVGGDESGVIASPCPDDLRGDSQRVMTRR